MVKRSWRVMNGLVAVTIVLVLSPACDFDPDGDEVNQSTAAVTPVGAVGINGGDDFTRSTAVTLSITADAEAAEMCVSNGSSCTAWEAFSSSKAWTLTSTDGSKTVSVWLRDLAGNASAAYTDSILLDTTAPANGLLKVKRGDGRNTLSWSGISDSGSGLGAASYRLVFVAGSVAPASACASGTEIFSGGPPAASFAHTGLTNGVNYYYRLCATDRAGNTSSGATAQGMPAPELNRPIGSLLINGGAAWTTTAAVSLTLSATDDTSVSSMCVSNSATCTAWVAYAPSMSWTLSATNGSKTVYAYFRDPWNNVSLKATDTIGLDAVAPTNGTVSKTESDSAVALSWAYTNWTDATSGIAGYRVVYSVISSPPSSCSGGTTAYQGTATSFAHTGLTNGTTYYYRICATDVAGKTSTGTTIKAHPPESSLPSGTVTIDGGSETTTSRLYNTLTLSATDPDSPVTQMCVSNSPSCAAWVPFATSQSWALTTGSGSKTVYVFFRDAWGNTSAAASDTIYLDAAPSTLVSGTGLTLQDVSADGLYAAYTDAAHGLYTVPVGGGSPTLVTSGVDLADYQKGILLAYKGVDSTTGYASTMLAFPEGSATASVTGSFVKMSSVKVSSGNQVARLQRPTSAATTKDVYLDGTKLVASAIDAKAKFSPDGARLVVSWEDTSLVQRVKSYPTAGGASSTLVSSGASLSFSITPDSASVVVGLHDDDAANTADLTLVPITGGAGVLLASAARHSHFEVLEDNYTLAYLTTTGSVRRVRLDGTSRLTLVASGAIDIISTSADAIVYATYVDSTTELATLRMVDVDAATDSALGTVAASEKFSPDEVYYAFRSGIGTSGAGTLKRVAVTGRALMSLGTAVMKASHADSTYMVTRDSTGNLRVAALATGALTLLGSSIGAFEMVPDAGGVTASRYVYSTTGGIYLQRL